MQYIFFAALLTFFVMFFGSDRCVLSKNKIFDEKVTFAAFFAFGIILRIACAGLFYGYKTDMSCFLSWADMLYKDGISGFYASKAFTDYPPGYMYVLWFIGLIKNAFHVSGISEIILVKSPAICADMLSACFIYQYLRKKNVKNASLFAGLFIINPAVILNSSLWGQVDSVMTLFVLITVILLTEKRLCLSYLFFAIAIFIKPQAFIISPLLIYASLEAIIKDFSFAKLWRIIGAAFGAFLIALCLALPFGIKEVFRQYTGTLASYPYVSVNAFNLWAAIGQNWAEMTPFMSITGTVILVLITISAFYILITAKNRAKYFFTAAFLFFETFMLGMKMHERYAYPAMIFMLVSFALSRDKRHSAIYALISASQLFNTAYILFIYESNPSEYYRSAAVIAASVVNLLFYLYAAYSSDKLDSPRQYRKKEKKAEFEKTYYLKFNKKDYILMGAITLVYAMAAFSSLGDMKAPETEYILKKGIPLKIEFRTEENLGGVKYYLGEFPLNENRMLTVTANDSEDRQISTAVADDTAVFFWSTIDIAAVKASSLTLISDDDISIKELQLYSESGAVINVVNIDNCEELFDEQRLVPMQQTYMNSTYFDEIYHARTAYEFIHKLPVYEWTHPPLGKIFISRGIRIFGMNPFGWRFAGVLFGILMLPLMYATAKLLFESTPFAAVASALFAVDFMHYTQTRIATIDVFVTFFIMLAYFFMFEYSKRNFYKNGLKKTLIPLGLSGISMGLSIACKWTGIYAAAGIAVIFFISIANRFREYIAAKNDLSFGSFIIPNEKITNNFKKYTAATFVFCVAFFVVIPIIIYALSYIPYLAANGEGFGGIIKNQIDIFEYHSKTVVESTHAYSSPWYTWPFMIRPIWYYSNSFPSGLKAGISAFGNPLVWWGGIAAFVFCILNAVRYKDKNAILLIAAYAANFAPWMFVERTTFIYHYFPSVPFVVLMIVYSFNKLSEKHNFAMRAALIYTGAAAVLFVLFYPVLTGTPVNADFVIKFLRWLPGWVLI